MKFLQVSIVPKTMWGKMILAAAVLALAVGCQQGGVPAEEGAEPMVGSASESTPESTASAPRAAAGQPASSQPAPPPAPPRPKTATFAEGTVLKVRTTTALSTNSHQAGDRFTATLEEPVVEGDWVIAPQGSTVDGVIVEADKGGRVQGVARLSVRLERLHTADGQEIEISTSTFAVDANTSKGKDAAKVAIGTGVGAAIGAIAGGGKGAGIGAAAGAGAGTGAVLATRGEPAVIGSEAVLQFELRSPVTISEKM